MTLLQISGLLINHQTHLKSSNWYPVMTGCDIYNKEQRYTMLSNNNHHDAFK